MCLRYSPFDPVHAALVTWPHPPTHSQQGANWRQVLTFHSVWVQAAPMECAIGKWHLSSLFRNNQCLGWSWSSGVWHGTQEHISSGLHEELQRSPHPHAAPYCSCQVVTSGWQDATGLAGFFRAHLSSFRKSPPLPHPSPSSHHRSTGQTSKIKTYSLTFASKMP
jgi:hypothetical protein